MNAKSTYGANKLGKVSRIRTNNTIRIKMFPDNKKNITTSTEIFVFDFYIQTTKTSEKRR
jgi:hypothetical protein